MLDELECRVAYIIQESTCNSFFHLSHVVWGKSEFSESVSSSSAFLEGVRVRGFLVPVTVTVV